MKISVITAVYNRADTIGEERPRLVRTCASISVKLPQTHGMVERFNDRIEEVLQSHHFRLGEDLETTLHRYVWL